MIRLTVLYQHPEDSDKFDRYYRDVHLPLARRMQGLKGWTIGKCQAAEPGQRAPYYMIVGLYADNRAAMEQILASPEGQATIADLANFAQAGVSFMYDEQEVLIPVTLRP
jgi:uncharacterized protein (TIGR02118 family)